MQYLVHIGYPKAVSTWLQTLLFSGNDPRLQPLKSNTPKGVYQKSGGTMFFNELLEADNGKAIKLIEPFTFDAAATRADILENSSLDSEITCLSSEAWTGHPFSGGIVGKEIADRIHASLPDAKILISVRRQEDAILSAYSHFLVETGGICSLKRFLNQKFHDQSPSFSPYYYCYDRLVKYYKGKFGEQNVLVLPMEVLSQQGKNAYLKNIYDFLALEPNHDLEDMGKQNVRDYSSYIILKSMPFLNLFWYPHPANGCASFGFSSVRKAAIKFFRLFLTKQMKEKSIQKDKDIIAEYMKPYIVTSNQALQKYVPYDLTELGYKL